MQRVQTNLILQLLVSPVFLIIDFILARYYPALTLHAYQSHWLFCLFILMALFCPLSRKILAPSKTEKPRFKAMQAIGLIWLFQLSIMAIFAGMMQLIQLLQPELKAPASMFTSLWVVQWGLFPWVAMTLMGCAYGYYAYIKGQDAFNSALAGASANQSFGITFNACARLNTLMVLTSSLMMGSIALAWLCTHFLGFQLIHGLNFESMLILTAILALVVHRKLGARFFDTLVKRKYPISFILITAMALIALLLVLGSALLHRVNLHPLPPPHWLFDQAPLQALLNLFLAFWALAWTFIAGVFIAYVSRGYTMRQLILMSLSLPLIGALWVNNSPVEFPPLVLVILGFMGACSMIYFLTSNRHRLPMLVQVYVAADDQIKMRGHRLAVVSLIQLSMALLYLYLPGGFLLLGLVLVIFALPAVAYLLYVLMESFTWIFKTKS